MPTDPRITLGALLGGLTVFLVTRSFATRRPRLAIRLGPHVVRARTRMGLTTDPTSLFDAAGGQRGRLLLRVFGPALADMADRASRLVSGGHDDDLARRLRHAGLDQTPSQWRLRSAGVALAYAALAGFGASLTGLPALTVLLLTAFAFAAGTLLTRGQLTKATDTRRTRMRLELYTLSQMLAMRVRTGDGPLRACQHLAATGRGPVAGELGSALEQITAGEPDHLAFERLATDTAEPAAARLYRLLSTAAELGGDLPRALRALADDLRSQQREDLERATTGRRGLMIGATVLFLAPVMLIFVAAPIPRIVFGAHGG